jgi:hypothetical protein
MFAFPSETSEIIITPKLGVRKIGGVPVGLGDDQGTDKTAYNNDDLCANYAPAVPSSRNCESHFPRGVGRVHWITSDIRIEIQVIFVKDRIRLQEPPELRRVHARFVVIVARSPEAAMEMTAVSSHRRIQSPRHTMAV